MNNQRRITLASFLAYFVMSGLLAPIGIISGPMAELFGQPVVEITARFSWLTLGNLVGAVLALFLFDFIQLRRMLVGVYCAIFVCLASLGFLTDLTAIGIALGVSGICSGLGLAGAALVISNIYAEERRASMLVITDGSFSVAGFVCAAIATWLIARDYQWSSAYLFVALVALLIIGLSLVSRFPATRPDDGVEKPVGETWPPAVFLCLGALFLYTLGQYSMLLWLPNYAETRLGASRDEAGELVSLFWFGMFAAQIIVAWWVMKIGVRRLVLLAGVATSLFSLPLWLSRDIGLLPVFAFLWGIANLSLLKVVLSFATQMVRIPTARLVSSLLLGATLGTALSPWVTSRIVAATDNYRILQFSTLCYVMLTVLLLLASRQFARQRSNDSTQ